jgi:hypothetical protein
MLVKLALLLMMLWNTPDDGAPSQSRRALLVSADAPVTVMQSELPPPPPE